MTESSPVQRLMIDKYKLNFTTLSINWPALNYTNYTTNKSIRINRTPDVRVEIFIILSVLRSPILPIIRLFVYCVVIVHFLWFLQHLPIIIQLIDSRVSHHLMRFLIEMTLVGRLKLSNLLRLSLVLYR